ncbi:hypothetical protein MARPO_0049s0023 [Marchantia polymorpha]|uniref:Uncharacterized protein n=1 Tax=Marchantia polymorpha TaxID=3197 RepID=A0A2R6WY18_MARPO|nr:hypothetical protein MARPO_0049s0023 [Marchantia polymorpha]|eukprot:PTQ38723.1 hypothetical protein MARPO_0049s0023 [Marchantia polymorpha]
MVCRVTEATEAHPRPYTPVPPPPPPPPSPPPPPTSSARSSSASFSSPPPTPRCGHITDLQTSASEARTKKPPRDLPSLDNPRIPPYLLATRNPSREDRGVEQIHGEMEKIGVSLRLAAGVGRPGLPICRARIIEEGTTPPPPALGPLPSPFSLSLSLSLLVDEYGPDPTRTEQHSHHPRRLGAAAAASSAQLSAPQRKPWGKAKACLYGSSGSVVHGGREAKAAGGSFSFLRASLFYPMPPPTLPLENPKELKTKAHLPAGSIS